MLFKRLILLFLAANFTLTAEEPKSSEKIKHVKESKPAKAAKVKKPEKIKVEKPKVINKNFSDLTFEDLEHNVKVYIEMDIDKDTLAKNLERMLSLCKDQDKICKIRLQLADTYFDLDRLERAANSYKEFVKLYPGNNKAEYALYREIVSNFKESLDFDRDQTKTKEALKLSQDFKLKSKNEEYLKEIKEIRSQCKKKLLKAEINIFYFYLKRGNFKAAQKRLDYLKNDFFKKPENEVMTKLKEHLKLAQDNKYYEPLDLDVLNATRKSNASNDFKTEKLDVELF